MHHYLRSLKFKIRTMYCGIRIWWSRVRYGIHIGLNGSMLPSLGRGKYVDVIRRGDCIEIRDHSNKNNTYTIRLIPYQPNHGIMVEYVGANGNVGWRQHMDSTKFLKIGSNYSDQREEHGK